MAGNFQINIAGDHTDELMSRINQGCREAFENIGALAEGYAKEICPVDTGRLRNSIGYNAEDRKVSIGTNVEYAPHVELGTSRTSPRPFIRPSVEDHIGQFEDVLVNFLKSNVE